MLPQKQAVNMKVLTHQGHGIKAMRTGLGALSQDGTQAPARLARPRPTRLGPYKDSLQVWIKAARPHHADQRRELSARNKREAGTAAKTSTVRNE